MTPAQLAWPPRTRPPSEGAPSSWPWAKPLLLQWIVFVQMSVCLVAHLHAQGTCLTKTESLLVSLAREIEALLTHLHKAIKAISFEQ